KVTDKASRFSHLFYPFQQAVETISGQKFDAFRQEAIDSYKNKVAKGSVQQQRETVTNYLFPQFIGDDSLLYVKTAYNKIPAFYIRDRDGEHRIKQRNITGEDWISYRNGFLAYTAYAPDPRWGLTDYSNIYLLNIQTGEELKITNKQRYFTPDLSPDGSRLAAIFFNDSTGSELHILTAEGDLLQKIKPLQNGDLFVHPRYINDHSIVVAVRHADATMSLQRIVLGNQNERMERFEQLLPPSASVLGYPFVDGDTIYFVSSATGNDEVFSLDLNGPLPATKLMQITSGTTGSYYPSSYQNKLVWSSFTSNGFRTKESLLSTLSANSVAVSTLQQRATPYKVATDAATPNLLQTAGAAHLPVQPYKKTTGLFKFHSRQLYYSDPELTVSFLSDNILNTFSNEVFYRYNQNESSHAVGLASYYGGFFPVLNAGITYTA
ncbi:MAG TPA: hypothetical protein VFL47_06410, partial [Flavisolibacter sp.]|nr:hypothetical protein [Flavisolibacter sp.]